MADGILETNQNIAELFKLAGIQRVIYVDDRINVLSVEGVIGKTNDWPAKQVAELFGLDAEAFEDDGEVRAVQIREKWDDIPSAEQRRIVAALATPEVDLEKDIALVERIQELLSNENAIFLHPSRWQDERDYYIQQVEEKCTLFLIDRNFGINIEGDGLGELLLLASKTKPERAILGLISHEFDSDKEYDFWLEYKNTHGDAGARIIPVSKKRKEDGLAHGLKRVLLNTKCSNLTAQVTEVLFEAAKEAKESICKLSIYDYEQIVFRTSRIEGVWEPDTLARIFNVFHRKAARGQMKANQEIDKLAHEIRTLSLTSLPIEDSWRNNDEAWKIQHSEMYDEAVELCEHHLPIDLGDIFEEGENGRLYILLAQPCDLMIRTTEEGKRKEDRKYAYFCKIIEGKNKGLQQYEELRYFRPGKQPYLVDFSRDRNIIDLHILDLCVFNPSGLAELDITQSCPLGVIPVWQKRYDVLVNRAKESLSKLLALNEHQDYSKFALLEFADQPQKGEFIKNDTSKAYEILRYPFRRIARLRQPWSGALLTKFAHYISRAAFDHDLDR